MAAHPIRWLAIILVGWYLVGHPNPAVAQHLSFRLPTSDGKQVQVVAGHSPITVICFLGTECPMARSYASKLNGLQSEFADQGVKIIGVMSNRQDSAEDIQAYVRELQVTFDVVHDAENEVADKFGATRTPEVFLLDDQLKTRYHGRIDDQLSPGVVRSQATRQDLRIAIEQVLAGKPVTVRETRALGCIIGRQPPTSVSAGVTMTVPHVSEASVTFSNQVARVLRKHCVDCHRAGEIGPFAMDSYEEVVGWAETMLETVDQGRMPPWHADPSVGAFANQRLMPDADKEILRQWIADGLPEGDPAELPPPQEFIDGWQLPREPDLVVEMRERAFSVPRDGVIEYQYFVADPGFEEDRWVTAAQVIPGSRSVVHHAIVFVRPPDGASFKGIGWLTAYVPGQRISALPPGRARRIPAGSKLVFQMHYTPNGVSQQDVSKVGLLFGDDSEITHEVSTLLAIDQEFEIPPGAAEYTVEAKTRSLPANGELLAITPHMHFRGKAFELFAVLASHQSDANHERTSTPLLRVPRYDFNWQHTYQLEEPLPLSRLESLEFKATFDNSADNPFNPDPSVAVTWGDQTFEEMAVAFFEVAEPRHKSALPSDVANPSPQVTAEKRTRQIDRYIAKVLQQMDANADGIIRKSEADIVVRHMTFDLWDQNQDGLVTQDELRRVADERFR